MNSRLLTLLSAAIVCAAMIISYSHSPIPPAQPRPTDDDPPDILFPDAHPTDQELERFRGINKDNIYTTSETPPATTQLP